MEKTHGHSAAYPRNPDEQSVGLTKRELMAAEIMSGIISGSLAHGNIPISHFDKPSMGRQAVQFTDALIDALNGKQ